MTLNTRSIVPRILFFANVLMLALMTSSCSGVSNNSGRAMNAGGSGGSAASSTSNQYLYVANYGSSSISGFAINADGSLSRLPGFPISQSMPATSLSSAKDSLLAGGCNNNGSCQLSLYNVTSTGSLSLSSTMPMSGDSSVALDPSGISAYANGGTQSDSNGTVSGFSAKSGSLAAMPGSPYLFSISGGSNPVSANPIVVDPAGKFLYMGSITPENEHTPAGSFGMASRSNDGSLSAFTTANGCISAGSVAVASEPGMDLVFASCVDDWSGQYWIGSMSVDQATGNITATGAFTDPTNTALFVGLAADPSGKWLAATDVNNNTVHILAIDATSGVLTDSPDHDFPAGTGPSAVAFDRTGKFVYVINGGFRTSGAAGSNNLSAYLFNAATGMLTQLSGSPYQTGQSPSAIAIAQP